MIEFKNSKSIRLFVCILILISLILNFLVFYKSRPNFPVILRTNDFGSNFLVSRYLLWQIPVLGIALLLLNHFLSQKLRVTHTNLSFLLNSVNIGIVIVMFLISLQIYILNR